MPSLNRLNTGLTCEWIVPTMLIPVGHPADKASRADKETEHVILWMEIYLVDSTIHNGQLSILASAVV